MDAQRQDWPAYLAAFHAERPGITEDLLDHAVDAAGRTPYDWLVQALPGSTAAPRVLDLACGSAPVASRLPGRTYVGVDLSAAELRRARTHRRTVAQADVTRLPVADGAVDAVVVSMALMLVPLDAALREVRRVLRPGGVLAATVPCTGPLPAADRVRWARLLLALRRPGLTYPNDDALHTGAFAAAGLTLQQDSASGFRCALTTPAAADRLLDSLYLPGVTPARTAAGRRVVRRWAGSSTTIPVRLLVATAD